MCTVGQSECGKTCERVCLIKKVVGLPAGREYIIYYGPWIDPPSRKIKDLFRKRITCSFGVISASNTSGQLAQDLIIHLINLNTQTAYSTCKQDLLLLLYLLLLLPPSA